MNPTLASIQVGLPQTFVTPNANDARHPQWTSAIVKLPVAGPVAVTRTNLAGDGQADGKHHGGIDKAVLAYSADHYPAWRDELAQPDLACGAFGENLTISGLDEHSVCIGDVWQIGDVQFEVSQPRQPCWKLGRRWGRSDLPKRVVATGRSGWYLRVRREGTICAGDEVLLVARPYPEWTVARAAEFLYAQRVDGSWAEALARLLPSVAND